MRRQATQVVGNAPPLHEGARSLRPPEAEVSAIAGHLPAFRRSFPKIGPRHECVSLMRLFGRSFTLSDETTAAAAADHHRLECRVLQIAPTRVCSTDKILLK